MDAANFFLQLAAILIFARVGAEVAERLGAPSVIGGMVTTRKGIATRIEHTNADPR